MRKVSLFTLMFLFAASMQAYALQPCSVKTVKVQGGLGTVYDPVPCVWSFNTPHASIGITVLTSLDSAPQLADIIIDGVLIGKTPATLILEQTNTQKHFTVVFRKAGFKDAVGDVTSGTTGKMKLYPDVSQKAPAEDLSKGDDLPPIVQSRCVNKAWINAFDLDSPVNSQKYLCPADRSRALFTREGTLACPDADTLNQLYNVASTYGWFIRPTPAEAAKWLAGDRSLMSAGQIKYLTSLGCTVYHDGTAVKIHEEDRGMANTNIGWVPEANLRNR
jgi:PEGA domain